MLVNPYNEEGKRYEYIIAKEIELIVGGKRIQLNNDEVDMRKLTFNLDSTIMELDENGNRKSVNMVNTYEGISEKEKHLKDYSTKYEVDVFRCDIKNIVTTAKDYNITVIWDDDLPVIDQTLIVEGKSIAEEGEAKNMRCL